MRKILYTKDFGSGWSTSMRTIPPQFACEYKPIIEAIERGEQLCNKSTLVRNYMNHELDSFHPAVVQFIQECQEKYDVYPCILGLKKSFNC